MDANPELCSRCGEGSVAYDDTGGCYVCQSCGFVASDQALLSCPEVTTLAADEKANTAGRTYATEAIAYKVQGKVLMYCALGSSRGMAYGLPHVFGRPPSASVDRQPAT